MRSPIDISVNLDQVSFMRTTNKLLVVVALVAEVGCGRAGSPDRDAGAGADAEVAPIDADIADIDAMSLPPQTSRLRIISACAEPIWIAHSNHLTGEQNVRLATGEYHDYAIPPAGLGSVRFWPKRG